MIKEIDAMFQAWANYHIANDPKNPMQSVTQQYKEFVGRSGNKLGRAIIPARILDNANRDVTLIDHAYYTMEVDMRRAIDWKYLEGKVKNDKEAAKCYSEELSCSVRLFYIKVDNAHWYVKGLMNSKSIRI